MGENIGVYLGIFREEMSDEGEYEYQFQHIDAEHGLGGKPYLGMHFMNDPTLGRLEKECTPNAYVFNDCLTKTVAPIDKGEEMLLEYEGLMYNNKIERKKGAKKGAKKGGKKGATRSAKKAATKAAKKAAKKGKAGK